MTLNDFPSKWYVLHTKSRCEKVVNEVLAKKSIDAFLPTIDVRSKRRDRKLMLNLPLFPGYIFVKSSLTGHDHLSILKTPGAVRLIGNKDGPVCVASHIIESLQIMVASEKNVTTENPFVKGDKVMVLYGPFTGVQGHFANYKGQARVVVWVDLLGQSASVEVDEADIERIP